MPASTPSASPPSASPPSGLPACPDTARPGPPAFPSPAALPPHEPALAALFPGFAARRITVPTGPGGAPLSLFVRLGGRPDGPPLLMLHGYPQSHALWHGLVPALAPHFRLVLPDLRGYGRSDRPAGGPDHAAYSKRAMAADLVALMAALGHARFDLVGHDRGARVAHRLALDHPQAVGRLSLLDIVPTLTMYERSDQAFATAYYHWFFLIQPAPLPERMIGADPRAYLHATLGGWGAGGLDHLHPAALADYEAGFCAPPAAPGALPPGVHAACEDYRAAAGIDLVHDRASRAAGQRLAGPLQLLWGRRGVIGRLFDPPVDWRAALAEGATLDARALDAGHFLAEERPAETAAALLDFLRPGAAA